MSRRILIPGQLYLLADPNSYFRGCIVKYLGEDNNPYHRDLEIVYDPNISRKHFYTTSLFNASFYSNLVSLSEIEFIEMINKL